MSENSELSIKLAASKTFSVADGISVKSRREKEDWGLFDEEWGFRIYDVPHEFRNETKRKNFSLAKQEEKEHKLFLKSRPYNIVIEPTNLCNLKCPLCPTGVDAETRERGMMELNNFKKLIDEIKGYCLQLFLLNWGESTLVKDLPEMIKYAADNGVFTRLSTNFSINYKNGFIEKLVNSGLGVLTIDIDGTTQEVYEKYRINGNLETVLTNTKEAIRIKKQSGVKFPRIQTRMLVMKHNEHQIDEFKKLSYDLGADELEFGNIQLNPNTAKSEFLPSSEEFVYATYRGERRTVPCHWPWGGFTVNWDGGISPCCIVDDQNTDFGNIFKESVSDIWNNEYYISARSEFSETKNLTKNTICNICKNDTHNPNLIRIGDTFAITTNKNVEFSK